MINKDKMSACSRLQKKFFFSYSVPLKKNADPELRNPTNNLCISLQSIKTTATTIYLQNTETDKVDLTPLMTAHKHDLLTQLNQTSLFSKRAAVLIGGSEKQNS